jgi:hypothetical protein
MPIEVMKPTVMRLKLSTLEFSNYNPRQISETAMQGLREALAELGLMDMPLVNVADGKKRIISGHMRARALMEEGYTEADCLVVEFDDLKEQMANITMNNPAVQGKWDLKDIVPTLDQITADLPKPDHMLLETLLRDIRKQVSRNPDLRPSGKKFAGGTPKSSAGVIYGLGQHRLYCGAMQDKDAFPFIFGKKRATACITDPPYNVQYEQAGKDGEIENDNMSPAEFRSFTEDVVAAIRTYVSGVTYMFMSSRYLPVVQDVWEYHDGIVDRWLAWVKTNPSVSSFRTVDFHSQFEWIMFGYKAGARVPEVETARTNLLMFPKPAVNKLHPTQKPLEVVAPLVEDATDDGEIVFDPFVGSGTTIIVCEVLKRVCFACEIDPRHVDTARRRWAEQVHGENCDWEDLTKAVSAI